MKTKLKQMSIFFGYCNNPKGQDAKGQTEFFTYKEFSDEESS